MNDRCPVTGAAATRMTREGFIGVCKGKRRELRPGDWRFKRCATCKGRPENWPPELTIITVEATMTAKKPTKPANATPENELLAKLQLDLRSREETLERLAGMLGCQPGDLEQAMATMQAHVQEIRDVVEPEVADAHPATLPDACKHLVGRLQAAHRDNDGLQQFIRKLQTKLDDAEWELDKLRADGREAWDALDGDVEECTLVELAKKRREEIKTLRDQLELARNSIEELEEAASSSPAQDGGEAASILHDLMRKLVDGRISLIHNHA